MKKVVSMIVFGVILVFAGCTLLPWVKDANNIYDWFKKPTEDVVYLYRTITYIDNINFSDTENYQLKFTDVDENDDNITVLVNDDGTNRYLVADRDENIIFYGRDQYFTDYDEDEVYLEAPVNLDNSWPCKKETRSVVSIDTTVTVDAGTFSDVVKVKIIEEDADYIGYYYWSISRGLIYYEITYEDGSYVKTELTDIDE
ncbi:MAG: hypothetical protein AB7T10_00470 [bacterium]